MRSFELRILVLHPHLDDWNDEAKILLSNEKVFNALPGKFRSPWICESRYANSEKQVNAMITLRRIIQSSDPVFGEIIDAFCEELFRVDGDTSLESIRNGEEVLFKPEVDAENNVVDQAFLRSFIINMGKRLTGNFAFQNVKTRGNNFFTQQPNRWFIGPMKAVVTPAECVQGLDKFLGLLPPTAMSSTNSHATAFLEYPPPESVKIQDTAQKVEKILSMIREGGKIVNVLEAGLLQLVHLDDGELNRAIDAASQRLEDTAETLVSALKTLLESGRSSQSINDVVDSLHGSIEQAGQLFKLADTETAAYGRQGIKWTGLTVLSLAIMVGGFLIPVGGASIVATKVTCIGGGALSATGCGYKAWGEWCKRHDSNQVRKLVKQVHQVFCRTWVFLTITHCLSNGLLEDDERLVKFAGRMAEEFKINDLLTHWGDKDYATPFIKTNRALIMDNMHEMMEAVRKRRSTPNENLPTEDDSTHPARSDHAVQQANVEEVNEQSLFQSSISSAEDDEPSPGELDSSVATSETEESVSELHDYLSEFHIPAPDESDGWGSGNGTDLDVSGLNTPTELSTDWDD